MVQQLLRIAAVVAVALAAALAGAPAVPAQDDDAQIALNSEVRQSLFYIEVSFTGRVFVPPEKTQEGRPIWSEPTTIHSSCSGFAVDPSGFVATAGHCVDADDDELFERIRESFVVHAVEANLLNARKAIDFLDTANEEQWPVEGSRRNSLPDRQVRVIQPTSPARVVDELVVAQVVDFQPFDEGDNALLKVRADRPLKPLVIANKAPEPGQTLTSVGWPGSVAQTVDRSRLPAPSFKSGTASSQQIKPSGAASVEINADVSGGMSGGPTVDNDTGEVLGVNSYGIVGESQAFNFITDAPELRNFLQGNGVTLAQSEMPQERSFPWWIIIAAGIVVLAAAVVMVLIHRGKIGRSSRAQQAEHVDT